MFSRVDVFTALLSILRSVNTKCAGPDINVASLSLIKGFEGFSGDPYADPVGWVVTSARRFNAHVDFSFPLSKETGTQLLAIEAITYQDGLTEALSEEVTLNANQYGALVSWTYNVGVGAVSSSTLVARPNEGEDPETVAGDELPKWIYTGSQVLLGLVRRRDAEIELFANATSVKALLIPC